jgi:hypothetical protein
MSDVEEVHVSAFVPKGHHVTLIGSDELRRLRAENKVLRHLAESLDLLVEEEWGSRGNEYRGWEIVHGFDARVKAIMDGKPEQIDERKEV